MRVESIIEFCENSACSKCSAFAGIHKGCYFKSWIPEDWEINKIKRILKQKPKKGLMQ